MHLPQICCRTASKHCVSFPTHVQSARATERRKLERKIQAATELKTFCQARNNHNNPEKKKKKKKKDSAGCDDTSSMIKGGVYLGARTRQPPTAQTIKKGINVKSPKILRVSVT
jgi:hypothetical protein